MTVRLAAIAALPLALLGCQGSSPSPSRACTAVYAYGLSITVTDAVTAAPVEDVTTEIRDGTGWVDPYLTVLGNTVMGAGERPGVYTITVRKDGYADWTRSGVTVTMTLDRCHVQGVHLDAALVPKQ